MRRSRTYVEGFRISRGPEGLLIEAIDYHARPLRLGHDELAELGLRLHEPGEPADPSVGLAEAPGKSPESER